MLAKIGFVVGGIALATLMMGRVESLVAHHNFARLHRMGSTVD
jgi:hypothetical protein